MLSVTRPHYAAIGGGGFSVYCPNGSKKGYAFDFRETAPEKILDPQHAAQYAKKDSAGMMHGACACGVAQDRA